MTAPAWMPLYVAEYLGDTGHLSDREHGVYLLLIMHYWQHGGLPNDDQKLARIARQANVDDWLSIRSTIAALFLPGWRHKRIDKEMSSAITRIEKRKKAGKIGGLASASKRQANVEQTSTQLHLHKQDKKEDTSLRSVSKKEAPPKKRATRIPADFQPDLDEAERLGLSRRAAEEEAAGFADYWRAKPANATKLDWPATWRNWVRKSVKDRNKGGNSRGQLEFEQGVIIKPAVISESPTRAAARLARGGR